MAQCGVGVAALVECGEDIFGDARRAESSEREGGLFAHIAGGFAQEREEFLDGDFAGGFADDVNGEGAVSGSAEVVSNCTSLRSMGRARARAARPQGLRAVPEATASGARCE